MSGLGGWLTGYDVDDYPRTPWRTAMVAGPVPEPGHARHGDPLAAYAEALAEISTAKAAVVAAERRALELRAIAVTHPLIGEADVRAVEGLGAVPDLAAEHPEHGPLGAAACSYCAMMTARPGGRDRQ